MEVWSAGTGTYAGPKDGYGNLVEIKRNDGLYTRYAHLNIITVIEEQQITEGSTIGKVGSTCVSTGPHLHFELLFNNKTIDPFKFFYH